MELDWLHNAIRTQLQHVAGPDDHIYIRHWGEVDTKAVIKRYYDLLEKAHPPATSNGIRRE